MKPNNFLASRFPKWKFFSVLPALMLAPAMLAGTDPLFQNNAVLDFNIPGNPPPQFDVTAFDNESVFNVNFFQFSINPAFFETWNTLNYTNNGTMTANAPIISSTSGGFIIVGTTFGAAFRFDKQTTNQIPRTMAGTFYNPGTIRCNSFLDGNSVFSFGGIFGFSVGTFGECIVSATNIINPGVIQAGVNSLIQLTGQNVDLTRSTLNIENLQGLFFGNTPGVISTSLGFGSDTNQDWDPGIDLTPTTAISSLPFIMVLTNSTPYFNVQNVATNLRVIRAVFLQDNSPNATHNVYIDPDINTPSLGFAAGAAHVEWISTYVDPTTCSAATSYLYLTDDYALGASTNVFVNNGTPDNFTFLTSTTPLLVGPVAPGFLNVFPSGAITNPYSFFDGQLVSTTVTTNATPLNPSGALTNLPGRVQITANNELDLSLAVISGQNYLSLTATNQFDGSVGAQIISPYSDINLGVTNGSMVITNLLVSAIPNWNGNVAAWSTRFMVTFTNTLDGINFFTATNDFRVLIVRSSQLTSVTAPTVQDLKLHATNSLVITDVFTVLRSLFADAQDVTLTTNGCGNGATSLQGELNMLSTGIFWQTSLPNVRNLTNNGAIRTKNLAVFGGPQPANFYNNFINHGLINDQGSTIYANYFEHSGPFTNGVGSFVLQSFNTVMTNGILIAGSDISITTGSLLVSNLMMQTGRALNLQVTNSLTDGGVNSGNIWIVGTTAISSSDSGFNLPLLPQGDLLGTTVTNIAPSRKNIINTWAGVDLGATLNGYTNNEAVGQLVLDALDVAPATLFTFKGANPANNAIYVDRLILRDSATNFTVTQVNSLSINTNMRIYYAQAIVNGVSVAEKLNHLNGDRLRWVTNYTGHFSSTNFIYPDSSVHVFNAALVQSHNLDSDGDGIVNADDLTPINVSSPIPPLVTLKLTLTNKPPLVVRLSWQAVPGLTNHVEYKTDPASVTWLTLTNIITSSSSMTNTVDPTPVGSSPPRFYRVRVGPN